VFQKPSSCRVSGPPSGMQPWSLSLEHSYQTHIGKDGKKSAELIGHMATVPFFARGSKIKIHGCASTDGDQTNDPFYLPPQIREILGEVKHKEIGDLRAWMVGQVESYLLRPNSYAKELLDNSHKEIFANIDTSDAVYWKYTTLHFPTMPHPIAGMHVRRTDHRGEAPFREVSEYMSWIDDWFSKQTKYRLSTGVKRRVFLATDEPEVIKECKTKYGDRYVFIVSVVGGRTSGVGSRHGRLATVALLSDIFHLSECDFVVGTSSSQVTRMSYELMQTHSLDGHNWKRFVTLDDPWYFP